MRMSRRQLVKGSAVLILSGSAGSAAIGDDEPGVARLEVRRAQLVAECDRLDRLWREARGRMPRHWRPGRKFMNALGELSGPSVGWPAAALSDAIALGSGLLLVRPSPRDLRELFEQNVIELGRAAALAAYRSRIGQLRDRLRMRQRWELDVGMPKTSDWLPLDVDIDFIDVQLQSLLGKTA